VTAKFEGIAVILANLVSFPIIHSSKSNQFSFPPFPAIFEFLAVAFGLVSIRAVSSQNFLCMFVCRVPFLPVSILCFYCSLFSGIPMANFTLHPKVNILLNVFSWKKCVNLIHRHRRGGGRERKCKKWIWIWRVLSFFHSIPDSFSHHSSL
jgi:hypothetical protein